MTRYNWADLNPLEFAILREAYLQTPVVKMKTIVIGKVTHIVSTGELDALEKKLDECFAKVEKDCDALLKERLK